MSEKILKAVGHRGAIGAGLVLTCVLLFLMALWLAPTRTIAQTGGASTTSGVENTNCDEPYISEWCHAPAQVVLSNVVITPTAPTNAPYDCIVSVCDEISAALQWGIVPSTKASQTCHTCDGSTPTNYCDSIAYTNGASPFNITNAWWLDWTDWEWWWGDYEEGIGEGTSFSFTNATTGWISFYNISAEMPTNPPACGVGVQYLGTTWRSFAVVDVGSMSCDTGAIVETNPVTYLTCVVTTSPPTFATVTASPLPWNIPDEFLPSDWVITGGMLVTNPDGSISRTKRHVDLSVPGVTVVVACAGCTKLTNVVIVAQMDYLRVRDVHRTANRSIRAFDSNLRHLHIYEDAPRGEANNTDDSPLVVMGAWCNQMAGADVELKVQFEPQEAGKYLLWKAAANVGAIDGASSGSFKDSDKVQLRLLPSQEELTDHGGKDFLMSVGFDINADKELSADEQYSPTMGVRVIGKPEYDYCVDSLTGVLDWKIIGASILYPDAADCLEKFMYPDRGLLNAYDESEQASIAFSDGSYDMKQSLGCDLTSITAGELYRYTWGRQSGFANRILESNELWSEAILAAIGTMHMAEWFADPANSAATEHVFTASFDGGVTFTSTENLHLSIHAAPVTSTVTIKADRNSPAPVIVSMALDCQVNDLYDFNEHHEDDANGWAARVQVAYQPECGRNRGKIYFIRINCNVGQFAVPSVPIDDLDALRSWFDLGVMLGQ